jgi:hypothetical protein
LISSAAESAGQGVGGVPVEVVPGAVIAAGGAGVGVTGEVLHVSERDTGVQGGGDRRVAQAVRAALVRGGDAGGAGEPPISRQTVGSPRRPPSRLRKTGPVARPAR